jgi:hypothetical protein
MGILRGDIGMKKMQNSTKPRIEKVEDLIVRIENKSSLTLEDKKQLDRLYEELESLIEESK